MMGQTLEGILLLSFQAEAAEVTWLFFEGRRKDIARVYHTPKKSTSTAGTNHLTISHFSREISFNVSNWVDAFDED